MANAFYTPIQIAKVAVAMAREDAFLAALINRDFEQDLFGGGGQGRTVNVRIPTALIARERSIDEVTASIVLDSLTETTVPITLGTHAYSAVGLSEGDLTLDLQDFAAQVLKPQVDAVTDYVENAVATALAAVPEDTAIAWNAATPEKTFTAIRAKLRKRGVPTEGLNVVCGVNVYAALLDANAILDASQSGSTAALRDGQVGKLRGFQIVESTRVGDDDIVAFHRDAFTLAVRAPKVPAGASFGQTVTDKGFSLRYLRDYDANRTQDRSIVSTFAGVKQMPLYKITRNYGTSTASVVAVPEGAAMRVNIVTPVA
jgi:hypothetical protein